MAITAEQRNERRWFLGSSDAPAVAGVDPWRTPMAVFLEKAFDVADLPNKGPIARGNRYEAALVDWASEELGVEIERNVRVTHADGICAANLDGRVKGQRVGVEAKVTSLADEFGEAWSDQIPDRILVQTHHQMYVADLDAVWVPVLLARHGRPQEEMFRVERNDDLISAIVTRNHSFWNDHVLPSVPPPLGGEPCLDVVKRIRRAAGRIAAIDPELVYLWEAAKLSAKEAAKAEELAKSALLVAVGDAEAADYGDEQRWLTYFEQKRSGYFVKPTTFRVLRDAKR